MKALIQTMFDPNSKFLTGSWLFMLALMILALSFPQLSPLYITLFFINFTLNGIVSVYHFVTGTHQMITWLAEQMDKARAAAEAAKAK